MYIIGPVRTAHFGRCRSFPNRFRIRRKAAADLGGGYFFRSTPNLIAAITSISNAMVSAVLMRSPPLRGNNRTVLTGELYHTRFALLCQFSAPPAGRLLFCCGSVSCASRVRIFLEPAGGLTLRLFLSQDLSRLPLGQNALFHSVQHHVPAPKSLRVPSCDFLFHLSPPSACRSSWPYTPPALPAGQAGSAPALAQALAPAPSRQSS